METSYQSRIFEFILTKFMLSLSTLAATPMDQRGKHIYFKIEFT